MSRSTLDNLYSQRTNLSNVIQEQTGMKIDLESKIAKLEAASRNLMSNIGGIEESYNTITNLHVDESMWKGTEKNKFEQQKSSFQDHINVFLTKTVDARDRIEEEKNRCETNLVDVESRISHYKGILSDVNTDIERRRNN